MLARIVGLTAFGLLPLALSAQANGPTSKGNALVGGAASVSRSTHSVEGDDDDNSATLVALSPHVLYFVAPRVALGGTLGYARASGGGSSSSSTFVGPEARVFFADPAAKAQPFIGATIGREWSNFDTPIGDEDTESTRYGGSVGVIFMATRQVGISSELYIQRSSSDGLTSTSPDVTNTTFGLRFGFAAFLMR